MTSPQTDQNLCICSVLYVLYYISSLCSGGFTVYDYSHVLVQCVLGVRRTPTGGNVHDLVRQLDVSPSTRRWSVEVYVSHDPHQEATVVFGYIEGSFLVSRTGDARERYVPNIYRFIHT